MLWKAERGREEEKVGREGEKEGNTEEQKEKDNRQKRKNEDGRRKKKLWHIWTHIQFGAMSCEKSCESGVSILDLSSNSTTSYLSDAVKVA